MMIDNYFTFIVKQTPEPPRKNQRTNHHGEAIFKSPVIALK